MTKFLKVFLVLLFAPQIGFGVPESVQSLQLGYVKNLVPHSGLDVLEWKALMNEGRYQIEHDEIDKFGVLLHYENLINKKCLAKLPFSLKYDGNPSDKECLELIDKLLSFDPDNAAALCVRDGIDAASCRDAYMRTIVWTVPELTRLQRDNIGKTIVKKLASRVAEIKAALPGAQLNKLGYVRYDYQKDKTLERYIALNTGYSQIFEAICEPLALVIVTREEALGNFNVTPKATSTPSRFYKDAAEPQPAKKKGGKDKSPMEELLDSLKSKSKKDDGDLTDRLPEEATQVRARIISSECDHHIDQLFKAEKETPIIVCARDGLYSPFCIDSLRRDRKYLRSLSDQAARKEQLEGNKEGSSNAATKPTPQPGFSEF